jgi:RNA polymerase sigma-70 factor (ECF subfamily)
MRRTPVTLTAERAKTKGAGVEKNSRARILKKPSEAFEAVFHEHWERVCGVAYRLTGDPDEAEDLALEAFWRLYRKPPKDERNLGGWLYRVAVRLGFNALRSRQRRRLYEDQAARMALEYSLPRNPAAEHESAEERRLIRQALSQMDCRSVQILVLRSVGMSYAEIAAATGVSPASVGTLLARAERAFEVRYRALEGRDL